MADPICRWRNPYFKTIRELIKTLPKENLSSVDGRELTNRNWGEEFFQTPYQLACQLGLYYEFDNKFIIRFNDNPMPSELNKYLRNWMLKYYVPNPYTKKGFENIDPKIINVEFAKLLYNSKSDYDWIQAKNDIFGEEIGNDDILINAINLYSEIFEIKANRLKLKDGIQFEDLEQYIYEYKLNDRNDKKSFFEHFDIITSDQSDFIKPGSKDSVLLSQKKLKWVIFETFKLLHKNHIIGQILPNLIIKESKINDLFYLAITLPEYFGSSNFIGQFDSFKNEDDLKSSNTIRYINEPLDILSSKYSYFTSQWSDIDGTGLTLTNFNRYLKDVTNNLTIIKKGEFYDLVIISEETSELKGAENIIYYGSPGTGKSHKIETEINKINKKFYERITFHPDFDNSAFIGGFKPISEKDLENNDIIKYKFVPQAFTNIYERAWKDLENQYYLVIEEINRGNCADIFGEIFQLLDRNSNYTVTPSRELKEYLENEAFKNKLHSGIINGLKLPPNLSILATMNTSDQSLFPMDSAFKRRWDWEYIPICYTQIDDFGKNNESFDFEINIEDGNIYSWLKFIELVNLNHIKNNPSLGMDKCIGNYFIKPDNGSAISLKPFINKVIFYLWNDVFKDEDDKELFEKDESYEDFFPIKTNGKQKIKKLFDRIGMKPKNSIVHLEVDNQLGQVAEPLEDLESE
ncbi:McrB family protein [Flavobacterium sp.]|jgi:hypothetical protein|uniref:McrB family protein n=1 Tax=Flavobacterium sp. TaxID=239 RepID=UPI0037C1611F